MRAASQPTVRLTIVMKPEAESPDPLRKVLREWRVTEPLSPRFQEGVWRRIQQVDVSATAATTTTVWTMFKEWLAMAMPRPALAVAYLSVLLLAGMAGGYWQARQRTAHMDSELGTRYVQSVDPYQKPPHI